MVRRIVMLLASCTVIYLLNFFIPRLMPGDPFDYTASGSGQDVSDVYTQEQKELLRAYYGLDQPWLQQLENTLVRNLHGDLGQSIHYKRPVSDILLERLPWSLWMMGCSLVLSLLLGVGLALLCVGTGKGRMVLSPVLSTLAEIPPFLTGVLLLFLVAAQVPWIPLSGAVTPFAQYASLWQRLGDILLHSLMPILALTLVTFPKFFFTAWASFSSVLHQPYMTNAKAKGLRRRRVWIFYLLANSIAPIVARLFLSVGTTVGGTILVENVFAYPGLGTVLREAVTYRDYPMIQGVFLLSALLVLVSLTLADLCNHTTEQEVG
ncbi:ABC transporter permease [Pseudoflavonifractor capillosus]|uniref:ABC transporter permease subunit n=1 Tax=Pseudoflavonifractor capillosus TaxID=106588 RepID=UPI00195856A1|nr:ABC transporter permease [Pseudoflavonifractor capillosus]